MIENSSSGQTRNSFFENFKAFPVQPRSIEAQAGHVSARAREARHQSSADGITGHRENDRYRNSGVFERFGRFGPRRRDNVAIDVRQFGRKPRYPARIAFGKAPLD